MMKQNRLQTLKNLQSANHVYLIIHGFKSEWKGDKRGETAWGVVYIY